MPGKRRPLVIGITGGIASGKSSVSKICHSKGAVVIDADLIGHRSYEPGTECYKKIVQTFGSQVVGDNGYINRRVLGGIIFSSVEEKKKLENIVWPEIKRLIDIDLEALKDVGAETAVVEAAVMVEAGWETGMHEVWVVCVTPEVACERLMKRNNLTKEDAEKRIRSQMTNEERIRIADRVIWNNGSLEDLEKEVTKAWNAKGSLRPQRRVIRNRRKIMIGFLGFMILAGFHLGKKKGLL